MNAQKRDSQRSQHTGGPRKYRVVTVRSNSRRKPRATAQRFTTKAALVKFLRENPSSVSCRHTLEDLDLSGVDLSGVNLEHANLRNTRLGQSNLDQANLDGADVTGAHFDGALMSRDQFSRTHGRPASMPQILDTGATRLAQMKKGMRKARQGVVLQ